MAPLITCSETDNSTVTEIYHTWCKVIWHVSNTREQFLTLTVLVTTIDALGHFETG